MKNKGVHISWDLSSASFAFGTVHQKSWMPSLNYSNVVCCKVHGYFYQRQIQRKLFLLALLVSTTLLLPAELIDSQSIGQTYLISQEDIMLTAGEGQGRCLPMNDELLIPCFGGDTGTKNTQDTMSPHQN